MLELHEAMRHIMGDDSGAIGWLLVGIILGVVLVIWLIAKLIGAIF